MTKFTNPRLLEQIGRGTLALMLAQFQPELAGHGLAVPAHGLDDEAFYREVTAMAVAGPDRFTEALHGIEVMATENGRERLATVEAVERREETTHAEFAARVWMAQPELFARKQEEMRITGLTSFEYYGSNEQKDRSASFTPPDAQTLRRVRAGIDSWLALHRGPDERVTGIDVFPQDGEWVFLIRRGDACKRVPMVEGERVLIRQFRPARDVVVAYSPERDELRMHGRSVRELRMLRELFGWRLFGDLRRFEARRAFTLEPLRALGPEALEAPGGSGIERIELRGIELQLDGELRRMEKADRRDAALEVPEKGRLVQATFNIQFRGQRRSRAVQVQSGNRLRMSRHCDATAVHRWLTERGFRCANSNHGWTQMNTDVGQLWE